jgi:hypothetical protein
MTNNKQQNMKKETTLSDNNFTISFVNGQITNASGIGHITDGMTNNFTGKLIYKNSELLEVIGSGELNNIAFSNKTSTDTANVDLNKPLTKITGQ